MNDLETSYAAAGFGAEIGFGKSPAVILIDAARAYVEPGAPLYVGSELAFHGMIRLVEMARDAAVPVIFTQVRYAPGGVDGGYFFKKAKVLALFEEGNALGDFDDRLKPQANDIVVTKQYASAFFGTSLGATLNAMDVDTCLLGGFSTSGCVRATSLDALQNGFRPMVVTDACGDRDEEVHNANLFDLGQKYADLKNLDQIRAYIDGLE